MNLTDKNYEWYSDFMDEIVVKIKGTSDQIYLTRSDLKEMLYEWDNEDEEHDGDN